MKKSTKGAVAAAAAAVLLLGGAGSLAYWNATSTVSGGTVASGHLTLTDTTTDTCAAAPWTIDSDETPAGTTFDPATDKLVPGDVITKACTYQIGATGTHLRADVTTTGGAATGDLASALTVASTFDDTTSATPGITSVTSANDGDTLKAEISLTFNGGSGNTTMDLSSALSNFVVTLQQAHA